MKVTFLGTGTSQGVPVIGCKCTVCMSANTLDKRLRSSVLIEYNNKNILIDAGPDFRQQMLRQNITCLDAILLTHAHQDHIGGLDDIRSFNYLQNEPIKIYGQKMVLDTIKVKYDYVFADNRYPGIPEMNLLPIAPDSNFYVGDICISPIEVMHLSLPVLGYRINDFAYITDANYISKTELNKLKGLKVLVINALRKEKHISHFTLEEALCISKNLKPKKTYLTHMSHDMGLHNSVQAELPNNKFLAYDGLSIEL